MKYVVFFTILFSFNSLICCMDTPPKIVQELQAIIEKQRKTIAEKDRLIDELTKELTNASSVNTETYVVYSRF